MKIGGYLRTTKTNKFADEEVKMAAVGAIRVGNRIGYFAIVQGRNWTKIYMEDDEDGAFLKAIAESGWEEYQNYILKIHELNELLRKKSLRNLVGSLKRGYGLVIIDRPNEGFEYSISDQDGGMLPILCSSADDAVVEFMNKDRSASFDA
ncbi:hypothetical protein V1281_001508 [Nitrobacteraceae bacterium AZCC 2161]